MKYLSLSNYLLRRHQDKIIKKLKRKKGLKPSELAYIEMIQGNKK